MDQFQTWMRFLRWVPARSALPLPLLLLLLVIHSREALPGCLPPRLRPLRFLLMLRCRLPPAAARPRAACSGSAEEQHQVAYEQFRAVAVWRKGMDVRVPLTAVLEVAPPQAA